MNNTKSEEPTILEFMTEILGEDIDGNETYGLIARWSEEHPYWRMFIVYDGEDGQRYCGGDYGLMATNMHDLTDLFTFFAKHNKKLIIDTKGYFVKP